MFRHTIVTLLLLLGTLLGGARRFFPPVLQPVLRCPHPEVAYQDRRALLSCGAKSGALSASHRLIIGLAIDINRASAADLEVLPRIGPVLSRRIVENRRRDGPFKAVEQLERVKGIGPATIKRLRSYLCVGGDGDGDGCE